ncbi:MAG: hypothetical protein IT426_16290 [Pirellulales bacterium]|nr:hypothetical protein [Pirellulales bacterium]
MTDPGIWLYRLLALTIIDPDQKSWGIVYSCYVGFNAFEACAWFCFGLFVAGRFFARRKTWYEILYALSFLAFGISDLMEIHRTTVGLLLTKGIILASILACRKVVLQFYPQWKF